MGLKELGEKLQATIAIKVAIKLSLAYGFQKMFLIGQKLKHVRMTYYFFEILIFFWLTLVDIYGLEFISRRITKIL